MPAWAPSTSVTTVAERVTATCWDAVASVCADLTGIKAVFAAGVTASVLYDTSLVVPQADEFLDVGLPCVVVGLGPWSVITGGREMRITYEWQIAVCHDRQVLGERIPAIADHLDELMDGFEQHAKAKLHAEGDAFRIQSCLITGGRGIEPRELRAGVEQPGRPYLVAVATAQMVVDVNVIPQPA